MNIIKITDINDSRLDKYYRDSEKSLHCAFNLDNGYFIAESELVINRALEKGYKPISFLIEENSIDKYKSIIDKCDQNIDVYEVNNDIYIKFKGYILIRGIMGLFYRPKELTLEEVCQDAKRIVVLEDVENPINVGAIFRNCAALFVDGILLTKECVDPLYRRSIRVSMGTVFNNKWAYVDSNEYIEILHKFGFKVVSFALSENNISIDDIKLNNEDKLAIVLGSEGYGIGSDNIQKSDYVCKIDMNEDVDSLNVASASAIALYNLCKGNRK